MDVQFVSEARGDALVVMAAQDAELLPIAKALDATLGGRISRAAAASRFTGALGQALDLLAPEGVDFARVLVVGVGKAETADALTVERWAAHAMRRLITSGAVQVAFSPEALPNLSAAKAAAHAATGARLGAYRFDAYRTKLKPEQAPSVATLAVVAPAPAEAKALYEPSAATVDAVHFARDLVSEPANILHPEEFASRLKGLESFGLKVTVLDETEMARLGMGALLGVGQGSARPPRLVSMQWMGGASGDAPLALVGKGVTFDTGGISIKPSAGMEDMKGDMGGAAAVAGAMRAIAAAKLKANVVGVVALVENMPGPNAQRPGDIVRTMSGQTIEVLNTDAEGRLILADAVLYAQKQFAPAALVDLATLTGAIIISLGHEYAGLFSSDDALAEAIAKAGAAAGEPVWRLPLGPAYDKLIDSPNADMKNISGKPMAGSIVGAQFIKRFISEDLPWAHIDIAGAAWKQGADDPLTPTWATGYGVRLLAQLVADRAGA